MAIQAQMYSENHGFPPLGSSMDWMDNACGLNDFCFDIQQQQQLQNQQLIHRGSILKNNGNHLQSAAFPPSIAAQLEKQRQEIDQFISFQNERLRLALQEQRKRQIALVLKKYESKAQLLLRHKDEEIAKAMNRTTELENFLNRMAMENQSWQRLAKENEAMVASLNNTIEQLRETNCLSSNDVEDAESCCEITDEKNRRGSHSHEQEAESSTRKMICKSCNSRRSSVIFLPCRHLCSCKPCESLLDSCPVCTTAKQVSIEALM